LNLSAKEKFLLCLLLIFLAVGLWMQNLKHSRKIIKIIPGELDKVIQEKASINPNLATKEQLALLPGIGLSLAEKIIVFRNQGGAFCTAEDLLKVKGLGRKKLERIRQYLTFN
jgi:competence ComEA-like helix-hairpin-helix protein